MQIPFAYYKVSTQEMIIYIAGWGNISLTTQPHYTTTLHHQTTQPHYTIILCKPPINNQDIRLIYPWKLYNDKRRQTLFVAPVATHLYNLQAQYADDVNTESRFAPRGDVRRLVKGSRPTSETYRRLSFHWPILCPRFLWQRKCSALSFQFIFSYRNCILWGN